MGFLRKRCLEGYQRYGKKGTAQTLFRVLPKLAEIRESRKREAPNERWCMIRGSHEIPFVDRIAGVVECPSYMEPWEAEHFEFPECLGFDKRGRLRWSESRYLRTFSTYGYEGEEIPGSLTYDRGIPRQIEQRDGRDQLESFYRGLDSSPIDTRLSRSRGLVVKATATLGKKHIGTRTYQYKNGRLAFVEDGTKFIVRGPSHIWQGIEIWKEEWPQDIDAALWREVSAISPKPLQHLAPSNKESSRQRGWFNAVNLSIPNCPRCQKPYTCLLNVPPVSVLWCRVCRYSDDCAMQVGAFYVDHSTPKSPQPITVKLKKASDMGEIPVPGLKPMPAIAVKHPVKVESQCFHKLGGWPQWIQGHYWPRCIRCKQVPDFWGQVSSDDKTGFEEGDSGVVYVFFCKACNVSASVSQCF